MEENGLGSEEISVYFGDVAPQEVENALNERIKESEWSGLSQEGKEKLRKIIQKINQFSD